MVTDIAQNLTKMVT